MSEKNISEFIDGELYEAENPWGADEEFYMALARRQGGPVLDLACGTGRLLLAMAREGIEGFGLDLAEPMLKLAEARKGKLPVSFQKADMRFFDLPRRFQLCVMSGHTFQMLLTKEDQRLCLARLAKTLLPGVRLSFETRNLAITDIGPPGQWQFWRAFQAPDGRWIDVETKSVMEEGGRVEYCQSRRTYRDGSGVMPSDIRLRYTPAEEVDALLAEAGFAVEERYGFWDKRPYDPKTSPEILTVARLKA